MSLHHQIMLDSPAGYWPLSEASGTTAFDRSGNGRNLTWNAAPAAGSLVVPGGGVLLGGTQEATRSSESWMYQNAATLECWINTTGTDDAVVSMRMAGDIWAAYISTTGKMHLLVRRSDDVLGNITGTPIINDGKIHHLAYTWLLVTNSQGVAGLYVDGTLTDSLTLWSSSTLGIKTSPTSPWHLAGESSSRRWIGTIGHLAFFTSVLSAARIKAHYEAGIRSGVVV